MMNFFRSLLFGVYGYFHYTKSGFEKRLGDVETISYDQQQNSIITTTDNNNNLLQPASSSSSNNNKVCIITGANSGIGYQTAMDLALRGYTLHLLCRNAERGKQAVQTLIQHSNNHKIYLHIVDLSDINSIRHFITNEIGNSIKKLNILINNAGGIVLTNETQQLMVDEKGFEGNFLLNTLGPYYLTRELIPLMKETARTDNCGPSRVIAVSTSGMFCVKLNLQNLQNENMINFAYPHSKRQLCCLMEELATLHDRKLVTFNSCHPGWVDTPGFKSSLPNFYETMKDNLRNLKQGADTQLYLALSEDVKESTGNFYEDRMVVCPHFAYGFTQETQQERKELIKLVDTAIEMLL